MWNHWLWTNVCMIRSSMSEFDCDWLGDRSVNGATVNDREDGTQRERQQRVCLLLTIRRALIYWNLISANHFDVPLVSHNARAHAKRQWCDVFTRHSILLLHVERQWRRYLRSICSASLYRTVEIVRNLRFIAVQLEPRLLYGGGHHIAIYIPLPVPFIFLLVGCTMKSSSVASSNSFESKTVRLQSRRGEYTRY